MPGVIVDGNDVFAVYEAAEKLIKKIKKGEGPALLECKTYRIKGHFVGDPEKYRTKEEVQKVFDENDPIINFEEKVLGAGVLTRDELDEVAAQAVEDAVEFARQSPEPDPSELYEDLYV
jgi:pyruvate dehydrogenase E1 component alpha subunit